jgi:hypothetical protein
MQKPTFVLGLVAAACTNLRSNGVGLMNMQPAPPQLAGGLDFDLLDPVEARACARDEDDLVVDRRVYWLAGAPFDSVPAPSRGVIAQAIGRIFDKNPELDSLIVTHYVVESPRHDESCATVYARGIALKKAGSARRASHGRRDRDDDDDNLLSPSD